MAKKKGSLVGLLCLITALGARRDIDITNDIAQSYVDLKTFGKLVMNLCLFHILLLPSL